MPTPNREFLVVDYHPIFLQGLCQFLTEEFPDGRATQVSSGWQALLNFRERFWSLVILDLSLPDKNGLDLLLEMKNYRPTTPILALTLHSEDRYAVRALRAGADGYIGKDSSPTVLGEAIRKVLSGGKYVSTALAEKLAIQYVCGVGQAPHDALSDREFQVLGLLAQGKRITSIGEELRISANTVSTYRYRILEKLHLQNTSELVSYAIRNRLIDCDPV